MADALSMGQLGGIFRRHWLVLILALVLGGVGGFFAASLIPPTYSATATELVKGVPGADVTANYQAAQYAISRARTYPAFVGSLDVLEAVRADLGGDLSTSEIESRLTATNPVDTPLVQITAQAGTPEAARDLANSAARHLATFITQIETVNGTSPVTVEVAVQASTPTDPTAPKPLLIAALAAFALGCVALAGVALFDRAISPWMARRHARHLATSPLSPEREDAEPESGGSDSQPEGETAQPVEADPLPSEADSEGAGTAAEGDVNTEAMSQAAAASGEDGGSPVADGAGATASDEAAEADGREGVPARQGERRDRPARKRRRTRSASRSTQTLGAKNRRSDGAKGASPEKGIEATADAESSDHPRPTLVRDIADGDDAETDDRHVETSSRALA